MADWKDLEHVDEKVWAQETKYPYDIWEGKFSRVKLLSVNWDKEYENIVNWRTKENRDAYLAEKAGHVDESLVGWNFKGLEVFKPGLGKHTGSIRTPLPYEYAIDYNYLYIEMYEQPVSPDKTPRREHYCYFITTLNKNAPNTTELFIELDTMSNYLFDVDIQGIQLRRGHYTHALTTADKFLENPLENNIGISIAEPDFPSVKPIVANERLISFQKNEPRVCITTTADFSELDKLWTNVSNLNDVKSNARLEPADKWWENFSDTPSASSFPSDANSPTSPVGKIKPNGAAPTMRVYSMSTTDYPNFILKMRNKYPQVIKTINSVFVLDSGLIDESAGINFLGYAFREVKQQSSSKLIEEFKLDKDMFGYDNKYKDFAKFYNGQFASLEVSNLNGQIASINVEDIAENLQIYARSSATFPFLKLEAFINGVGGNNKKQYSVKPWSTQNAELFESSWEDFKFDIDIPTYGIFIEAREEEGPKSAAEISAKLYDVNETIKASKNVLEVGATNDKVLIKLDYDNDVDRIKRNLDNDTSRYSNDYTNALEYNKRVNTNDKSSITREKSNAADRYNVEYSNDIKKINNEKVTRDRSNNTDYAVRDIEIQLSYRNDTDSNFTTYDIGRKVIPMSRQAADISTLVEYTDKYNALGLSRDIYNKENTAAKEDTENDFRDTLIGAARDLQSNVANYLDYKATVDNHLRDVENSYTISQYNLAQDLMLYNDLQPITSASARLNVVNMGEQGDINIIKGALETVSAVASGFNVASMVGSGLAGVGNIAGAAASATLDIELLRDQTNLTNSKDTVNLSSANYSGPSKGKVMVDYNQAVDSNLSLRNRYNGQANNLALSQSLGVKRAAAEDLGYSIIPAMYPTPGQYWNALELGGTVPLHGDMGDGWDDQDYRMLILGSMASSFMFKRSTVEELGNQVANTYNNYRNYVSPNETNNLYTKTIGVNKINEDISEIQNVDTYNVSRNNIGRTRTQGVLANNSILSARASNVNDDTRVNRDVASSTKGTSEDIASRNYSTDNTITNRTKTSDDKIALNTRNALRDIALNTSEIDSAINSRTYNTKMGLVDNRLDVDIERLDTDVRTNLNTMKAKYYNDIQGAATQYGADSGEAWVDNWGHRGINIRVRRCSKNIERIAGDTFTRFGYYAEGMWVDQPDLSLMTKFTYWETEDIWIYGNNINETNKQIIRDAFNRGVTIWEDPEEVCRVDIYSNKTI